MWQVQMKNPWCSKAATLCKHREHWIERKTNDRAGSSAAAEAPGCTQKPGETPKGVDQVLQSFNLAIQIEALELFLLLVLLLLLFSDTVCLVKAWCMENIYL